MNLDSYAQSPWLGSWDSSDPSNEIFPIDEIIIEVMSLNETPLNDIYHCSSFLPSLSEIPSSLETFISHNLTHPLQTQFFVHEVLSKGSMGKITITLPVDFSFQPDIVKIFQLGAPFPHHEINFFLSPFMRFFH